MTELLIGSRGVGSTGLRDLDWIIPNERHGEKERGRITQLNESLYMYIICFTRS
jgi:hypothetical protein